MMAYITEPRVAKLVNPASDAKIATASRIEASFRRVEMETRASANSIGARDYFVPENGTKPPRFGIFTNGRVCAFITSLSLMMPLSSRI